jgi:hypothetical protein
VSHRPSRPQACVPRHASPGRGGKKQFNSMYRFYRVCPRLDKPPPRRRGRDTESLQPKTVCGRRAWASLYVAILITLFLIIFGSLNRFPTKKNNFVSAVCVGVQGRRLHPPLRQTPCIPNAIIYLSYGPGSATTVETGPSYIFLVIRFGFKSLDGHLDVQAASEANL